MSDDTERRYAVDPVLALNDKAMRQVLQTASEVLVRRLLRAELSYEPRMGVVLRLHTRLNQLRAPRERRALKRRVLKAAVRTGSTTLR